MRHVRPAAGLSALVLGLLVVGCGYTTRPGLAPNLKTVYIQPFVNKIDVTRLTSGNERFPIYRHQMEVDISRAVVNLRFINQTTGEVLWEEPSFIGDTTYFAVGPNAESESRALDRAITDLARRIVERAVESW